MAIRIEGAEVINAQLRRIREEISERDVGKPLYKSLMKAANPIVKQAKNNAPVLTGNIKANIRRKRMTKGEYAHFQGAAVGVVVNPKAYYYVFHEEYGARGRAPIPFLRPALEQNEGEAVGVFEREIVKDIKKIWGN